MTTQPAEIPHVAVADAPSQIARGSIIRRYPQLTISPAVLIGLLAAWWLASNVLAAPAYILPPP